MSQENVDIIRRVEAAINANEPPPHDLIAPGFELRNATTAVTDATYVGYDGALKWRKDMFDVVDDARIDMSEVVATGTDFVVVATRLVGRGSLSGAPVDLRWTSVFWFRDGQIIWGAGYGSRREALEAVDLSE